jgi:hypothetical protein
MKQVYSKFFYVSVSGLMLVALTGNAYADTYNFFFDKSKKKGAQQEASEQEDQNPDVSPAPDTSPVAQPAPSQPVQGGSGAPIVINNNVSVPHSMQQPAPAPVIAPEPQSEPISAVRESNESNAAMNAAYVPPPTRRQRWKLGLSAFALSDRSHFDSFSEEADFYGDIYSDTSYAQSKAGALVSLGYRFAPAFGFNAYVGDAGNSKILVGIDGEWLPLRLDVGSFDLLEIGGIVGATNIVGSGGYSQAALLHLGARVNVNLGPAFTLTASGRVNKSYAMAELGLALNL